MACTVQCKITLNRVFRRVLDIDGRRHIRKKQKYLSILRECVALLFMRVDYPNNVGRGAEMEEFGVVRADQYQAVVLIKARVSLPPGMDAETLESEIKTRNMVPEFIRNVKVIRMSG